MLLRSPDGQETFETSDSTLIARAIRAGATPAAAPGSVALAAQASPGVASSQQRKGLLSGAPEGVRDFTRSALNQLETAGAFAGGTIGGVSGAATGAVAVPGVGAVPGGLAGGIAGATVGAAGGKALDLLGQEALLGEMPTDPGTQISRAGIAGMGGMAAAESGVAGVKAIADTPAGKLVGTALSRVMRALYKSGKFGAAAELAQHAAEMMKTIGKASETAPAGGAAMSAAAAKAAAAAEPAAPAAWRGGRWQELPAPGSPGTMFDAPPTSLNPGPFNVPAINRFESSSGRATMPPEPTPRLEPQYPNPNPASPRMQEAQQRIAAGPQPPPPPFQPPAPNPVRQAMSDARSNYPAAQPVSAPAEATAAPTPTGRFAVARQRITEGPPPAPPETPGKPPEAATAPPTTSGPSNPAKAAPAKPKATGKTPAVAPETRSGPTNPAKAATPDKVSVPGTVEWRAAKTTAQKRAAFVAEANLRGLSRIERAVARQQMERGVNPFPERLETEPKPPAPPKANPPEKATAPKTASGPTNPGEAEESGFLYHTTDRLNVGDIADQGLLTHRPSHRGEQKAWPTSAGGTGAEGRTYMGKSEKAVEPFSEPGHVTLRIDKSKIPGGIHNELGDLFTRKKIPPEAIEVKTPTGWEPIKSSGPTNPGATPLPDSWKPQTPPASAAHGGVENAPQDFHYFHATDPATLKQMGKAGIDPGTSLWKNEDQATLGAKGDMVVRVNTKLLPGHGSGTRGGNPEIQAGKFDDITLGKHVRPEALEVKIPADAKAQRGERWVSLLEYLKNPGAMIGPPTY